MIFYSSLGLCIISYFLGLFIAKKSKKSVLFCVITSLCVAFFLEFLRIYRVFLWEFVPIDIAIYLEKTAFVPFAILFFAICSQNMSSKFLNKALHIICFLLLGYHCIYSSWMVTSVINCRTQKIVDGVYIQSTPSTCGPASLATVLKFHGIDVSEQQMANLSHTTKIWGTTSLRMMKALCDICESSGIKNYTLDLEYQTWEELRLTAKPCIVDTKYSSYMNHVMVVFAIKDKQVTLGDPLEGKIYMSKDKFLEIWTSEVIVFKKDN